MRFGRTKQWDEPGQHAISEAVRKATNKYLTRPDAGLNAKVGQEPASHAANPTLS